MIPNGRLGVKNAFDGASWIWPENHSWDILNGYALFRKTFSLRSVPKEAPLAITADQSYQLYVNGTYICRGPARGFQAQWPYDEIDIAEKLLKGRNVIAVRAYNPGHGNSQYISQGWAGLLVAGKWAGTKIATDKSWRCRRQQGVKRGTVPSSISLFCQEHIDLRQEDPNWMRPEFDDTNWTDSVCTHEWDSMPWNGLSPRGIPMLEEEIIYPDKGLGLCRGESQRDFLESRDVARTRFSEGLAHQAEKFDPKRIEVEPCAPFEFRSYLLDFGRTVVGSCGLEIEGARGGEVIDTLHVETIDEAALAPHFVPDKPCRMAFGQRMICRERDQSHFFYHAYGFRYLVITVRGGIKRMRIRPSLRTAIYPLQRLGAFHSSDAALESIWETCAWTQRICSLDAYVDTPWREQAQWWGDARVQAKNTFFISGDTRLFRRGIAQIAYQTAPGGLTYGHAPTVAHGCILPDFTIIWLLTLWDYYWQTGSLEPFEAHQETIRQALRYFEDGIDSKTGMLAFDKRYWLFLDWAEVFKDGYSTVYTMWLLIALDKLVIMSRKSGEIGVSRRLAACAARLRAGLEELVSADGLVYDGRTFEREIVRSTSIHTQTLAILARLSPQHNKTRIDRVILPYVSGGKITRTSPSCYWITNVFEILTAARHGPAVVNFIREKWEPMAKHGTTWEVFQPRVGDESFSHAWSAHPLYHLMEIIGGVRQTAPAWREIIFQPEFIGDGAEVSVPTPFGIIHSRWKRDGNSITASLSLPHGILATTTLPNCKISRCPGPQSWKFNL